MNNKSTFYYRNEINRQNQELDIRQINIIEEKCKQQRSEAILRAIVSFANSLRALPEAITRLADKDNGKIASPSLSFSRPKLHTE